MLPKAINHSTVSAPDATVSPVNHTPAIERPLTIGIHQERHVLAQPDVSQVSN